MTLPWGEISQCPGISALLLFDIVNEYIPSSLWERKPWFHASSRTSLSPQHSHSIPMSLYLGFLDFNLCPQPTSLPKDLSGRSGASTQTSVPWPVCGPHWRYLTSQTISVSLVAILPLSNRGGWFKPVEFALWPKSKKQVLHIPGVQFGVTLTDVYYPMQTGFLGNEWRTVGCSRWMGSHTKKND